MRSLLRCAAIAAWTIILVGLGGCGSPNTRFNVLTPLPPGATQGDPWTSHGPTR